MIHLPFHVAILDAIYLTIATYCFVLGLPLAVVMAIALRMGRTRTRLVHYGMIAFCVGALILFLTVFP